MDPSAEIIGCIEHCDKVECYKCHFFLQCTHSKAQNHSDLLLDEAHHNRVIFPMNYLAILGRSIVVLWRTKCWARLEIRHWRWQTTAINRYSKYKVSASSPALPKLGSADSAVSGFRSIQVNVRLRQHVEKIWRAEWPVRQGARFTELQFQCFCSTHT